MESHLYFNLFKTQNGKGCLFDDILRSRFSSKQITTDNLKPFKHNTDYLPVNNINLFPTGTNLEIPTSWLAVHFPAPDFTCCDGKASLIILDPFLFLEQPNVFVCALFGGFSTISKSLSSEDSWIYFLQTIKRHYLKDMSAFG